MNTVQTYDAFVSLNGSHLEKHKGHSRIGAYVHEALEESLPSPRNPWAYSSGLQANFAGRVTLSSGSTLPALLTRFVTRDILCNVQDLK